jgi:nucleoside phosphorylase
MFEGWQVIAAITAGVFSVGIVGTVVGMLMKSIEQKVDKSEYGEHCRRVDGMLESGQRQFNELKAALKAQSETLGTICVSMEQMRGTIARVADKLNVPTRRGDEG